MDANVIQSWMVASGALLGPVVASIAVIIGLGNRTRGQQNAAAIRNVDEKVNGHLTTLTNLVAAVDPAIAAEAAAKVIATAESVRLNHTPGA